MGRYVWSLKGKIQKYWLNCYLVGGWGWGNFYAWVIAMQYCKFGRPPLA
jgi:hypothetical protein